MYLYRTIVILSDERKVGCVGIDENIYDDFARLKLYAKKNQENLMEEVFDEQRR